VPGTKTTTQVKDTPGVSGQGAKSGRTNGASLPPPPTKQTID